MSAEPKRVELTEAEKVPLLQAYAAGPIAMLYAVQDIVAAREAAARREALLEGDARRRELSRNLERSTELCRKAQAEALAQVERVARVEALADELAMGNFDHREERALAKWVASRLRADLAEPERDEEGGR